MARATDLATALRWAVVIAAACSHPASSLDESGLEPVFDAIGDRMATDIRTVARQPLRSKLAAIEPLAWTTPAAFPRYAHILAEYHVDLVAFAAFTHDHQDAFESLVARMERRTAPALAELQHAVADLPATGRDDCKALARRVEAARQSPVEASLATVLAASLPTCVALLGDAIGDPREVR